jgi:hypothetical protein
LQSIAAKTGVAQAQAKRQGRIYFGAAASLWRTAREIAGNVVAWRALPFAAYRLVALSSPGGESPAVPSFPGGTKARLRPSRDGGLSFSQSWAKPATNTIATIIATRVGIAAIRIDGRTRFGRLSLSGPRNESFISYCSSDPTMKPAITVATAIKIPVKILICLLRRTFAPVQS